MQQIPKPGVKRMVAGAIIAAIWYTMVNEWGPNCYYFGNNFQVGSFCLTSFAYRAVWVIAIALLAIGAFRYFQGQGTQSPTDTGEGPSSG